MGRPDFEDLEIYRLAESLANEVWDMVSLWDQFAKDTVGKQIVRSADSVCANIAEGRGRGSLKDNQRFIRIARGSLYETTSWLRLAYRRKLPIPNPHYGTNCNRRFKPICLLPSSLLANVLCRRIRRESLHH
ncbi:MAG: four helix bundle protein [Pseudanabaena sp. M090S1SP1A06QC]|jgi:four helix bundle protein|nr:four helix bundle protein [Pseudanabaena sp. M007S1SP1A06QC]MCA6614275.1 four helix bundle protein [Pseudanabaena sp. M090S1SP1A06QC]